MATDRKPDPAVDANLPAVPDGDADTAVEPPSEEVARPKRTDWIRTAGSDKVSHAARRVREARDRARQSSDSAPSLEPARSPRVFISYSRRDKLALDVCDELKSHGVEVFVDKESIPGGKEWAATISRGIRDADAFIVFLSSNVAKRPDAVLAELQLAASIDTQIIPVRLNRMGLPPGFDLFLTGVQWIDLYGQNYAAGLEQLLAAIGETAKDTGRARLRDRAQLAKHRVRRFTHQHELGSKLRTYGSAAAGGALIAAAFLSKGRAEQEKQQALEMQLARQLTLQDYIERTSGILGSAMTEITLTDGMTREEYRDEFRPAISRILGQLEATLPPVAVEDRHKQLVDELQGLLGRFDDAARKADSGDEIGYGRAITRLNVKWAQTVTTMLTWLSEAADEAGLRWTPS